MIDANTGIIAVSSSAIPTAPFAVTGTCYSAVRGWTLHCCWAESDLREGLTGKSTLKTVGECHYESMKPARDGREQIHMGNVGYNWFL